MLPKCIHNGQFTDIKCEDTLLSRSLVEVLRSISLKIYRNNPREVTVPFLIGSLR